MVNDDGKGRFAVVQTSAEDNPGPRKPVQIGMKKCWA